MSDQNDSVFTSALKWSHNYIHHPPNEPGVNWLWIIIIVILLLLAAWWWWSNYRGRQEPNNSAESKPMDDLKKGAKSTKENYMILDKSGRATAR